ncbi:hypothetical protein ABPG74_000817 [Tetrahymena malaccensis]
MRSKDDFNLQILFYFMLLIAEIFAFERVLLKYYDSSANCQSELQTNWNVIGGGSFPNINNCQQSCSLNSITYTAFYLAPSQYPNGFEITKTLTSNSSVLGFDLAYFVSGQFTISIYGDNKLLYQQSYQQTAQGSFPQEIIYHGVNCQGSVFKTIFISKYIKTQNVSKFHLQFSNLPSNYGFYKIYMWSNCVLNCDQCQDSSNCSVCNQGFQLMIMPSGQKVCSQQEDCQSSNCLECAISGITEVCLLCIPGYKLNSSNICVSAGLACSAGQYRSEQNTCETYTSNCLRQNTSETTWLSCFAVPDQATFKCFQNKVILLYQRGNYNTRVCGCNHLPNCSQCNTNTCTQCKTGYSFSGSTCVASTCPIGYQLNPVTKACSSLVCSDQYCLKCDQFVCQQCLSSSQYVSGTNPLQCKYCNIPNCKQCNPDGTCKICLPSYFMDATGNCISCAQNCLLCNNPQICQQCVSGYVLSNDKTSCVCTIPQCFLCNPNDGTICTICNSGVFDQTSKTCKCTLQNCDTCLPQSNTKCFACKGVFILDLNNQCQCPIKNCQQCDSTGSKCLTCATNFILSSDSTQCLCTVQYCSQCSGNTCIVCNQGFTLIGNQCIMKAQNCNQPDPTNGMNCLQCITGYQSILDDQYNNLCQCNVQNCNKCQAQNGNLCEQCYTNYQLSGDKTQCQCSVQNCMLCNLIDGNYCDLCNSGYQNLNQGQVCKCQVSNCLTCNAQNGNICNQCQNNYLSTNDQQCKCQVSNCLNCNPIDGSFCDNCVTGYISQNNKKNCQCAVNNCQTCNQQNGSLCNQCTTNYIKTNDQTQCNCSVANCRNCNIADGSICDTCVVGYIPANNNNTCQCSVANCLTCNPSNGQLCNQCQKNYILSFDSKQCNCSVSNCQACNSKDGQTCDTCVNGYLSTNNNTICQCNVNNCLVCNLMNGTQCDQCKPNFQLSNDKKQCICQSKNCYLCSALDGNICGVCNIGYTLKNGQCECGVANCLQCNPNNGNICQQCQTNFLLSIDQLQCQCQVNNCQTCNPNDGSQCDACVAGFIPQNNNKICSCNVKNCQQCNPYNGSLCNQCYNNYALSSDSSQCNCSIIGCQKCNNSDGSICDTCISGYVASNNNKSCECQVENCQVCDPTNGLICKQCFQNYILSNDKTKCNCSVSNCQTCKSGDGSICDSCANRYTLSNNNKDCECGVANCLICNPSNGQICNQCQKNFNLNIDSTQCNCEIPNCQECNPSDGSICNTCAKGYVSSIDNKICKCLSQNCLSCDPLNGNLCLKCQNNYTLNQSQQCICSVPNCKNCNPNDGLICDSCDQGFIPINNNKVCQCGIKNCLKCNHLNENTCQQCQVNYTLNSDSSQCSCSVLNCFSCNINDGSLCEACMVGFSLQNNNKVCQPQIKNCLTTDPQNNSKCIQCQLNYILNEDQTQCNCNVLNCQNCNSNDGSICDSCQSGYISLKNKSVCSCPKDSTTCINQCKVQKCKECQANKLDKCETCVDNYYLDNDLKCILSIKNDFTVTQSVVENIGYNITIQFQNEIITTTENVNGLLSIQIIDYNNPFKVNILNIQKKLINLQISMEGNCKDKNLIVKMNDPQFVQVNNLQEPQKQVQLGDYIVLTQSQIQQAQATKQAASKTSSTLLIVMVLMTIIGNTYVLFSTIDLTTFIYFMLFVDVRYPDNVMSFCSIFQNFQFAFVPNTIQIYFMDANYTQPYTPQKFIDNGYDAQNKQINFQINFLFFRYFFNGAGQSFTIIVGILLIYSIIKILSLIPIPQIRLYILSKIKSGWEYNGFFDLVGCVYVYVLVSSLLQFYCFKFDESLAFINYTLFSLSFIFMIIYPIMLTIFIVKCKNLRDPNIQLQFGSIIGGFVLPEIETIELNVKNNINNKNSITNGEQKNEAQSQNEEKSNQQIMSRQKQLQLKWSKFTNVILYLRKIIFIMVLLYFYGFVYFQIVLVCLMNLFLAFYYLYVKPQEDKSVNIKNGISEILLIIMYASISLLVEDDENQDEQHRFNIGWVIIASASTILVIHIFSVIIDLLKGVITLIKDFICTLFKSKKDLEKIKQEKLGEINQSEYKTLGVVSQISLEKIRNIKKKFSTIIISQIEPTSRLSISPLKRKISLIDQSIISPQKKIYNSSQLQDSQKINNLELQEFCLNEKAQSQNQSEQINQFQNKIQNVLSDNQLQSQYQPLSNRFLNQNAQSLNISNNDLLSHKDASMQLL